MTFSSPHRLEFPFAATGLFLSLLAGIAAAQSAPASQWREGISRTSYGRFGALGYRVNLPGDPQQCGGKTAEYEPLPLDHEVFGAGYPFLNRTGCPVVAWLTCGAGDRHLFLGHGGFPGRGGFETPLWTAAITWAPKPWTLVKRSVADVTWIGAALHQTFRLPDRRVYDLTVRCSSAWPAIRLETKQNFLLLQDAPLPEQWGESKEKTPTQYKTFFTAAAFPDGRTSAWSAETVVELRKGGEWPSNWMLLWQGGSPAEAESFPLLVVFHHKPDSICFQRSPRPTILVRRAGGVGAVSLLPLYGADMSADNDHSEKTPAWLQRFAARRQEVLRTPPSQTLPESVRRRCEEWSAILLGFPVSVREDYTISDDLSRVTVRNVFRFDVPDNEWGKKHRKLAILPPMVPLSQRAGYPLKILSEHQDLNMVTYLGPLVGRLEEEEVVYELPVPPWGECSLVKVQDPKYAYLTERLSEEISRRTPQAWMVPDPKEPKIGRHWDPAAQGVDAYWRLMTWPLLKPEVARELQRITRKELFDYMLQYDKAWVKVKDPHFAEGYWMPPVWEKDWAVTYALMGPAAYAAVTGDVAAIRENWTAVKNVYSYYRLIHDWPTLLYASNGFGTFPRTECDPFSMGYEGAALAAQLAAQADQHDDLREILYILSKISCGHHSRFYYMDDPTVFWKTICDAAFQHQQTFSAIQGWHPYGPIEVAFHNWGWGMMFIWHPATPNATASYARFNRKQADKILLEILPRVFPGWDVFTDATEEKPGNAPPWGYDNLLMMQAAMGHRSAEQLLQVTEANKGRRIRLGQYTTFQAADVRVFPLLQDAYFFQSALWNPQNNLLTLQVQPAVESFSRPVRLVLRTERPVEELRVNGKEALPPYAEPETGLCRLEVSLPATVELRFGPAPVLPRYKSVSIRQTLKLEPLFDPADLRYDFENKRLVNLRGETVEKLRWKITAGGKPAAEAEVSICRALNGGGDTDAQGIAEVPVSVDSTQFTDGITTLDKASVLVKAYHRLGFGQRVFTLVRKKP